MPCDEGNKSFMYGMNCSGSHKKCQWCKQNVCDYHFGNNSGGSRGGHSGCGGPKCHSNFATCSNTTPEKCTHCSDYYCKYHLQPVGSVATMVGGHNCPKYTTGYAVAGAASAVKGAVEAVAASPFNLKRMKDAQREVAMLGIKEDFTAECLLTELAQMAYNVYDLHTCEKIRDQRANKDPKASLVDLSAWSVAMQECQPNFSGYPEAVAHAVWVNPDTHMAVLALKGTDPDSATDISHDLRSVIMGEPPIEPLRNMANIVKDFQGQGYRVMVTGHSLGGYLAEVVASSCGISGVGFCAPGTGWHRGPKCGEGKGFRNINFENDMCGNLLAGVFDHGQWSVYIQDYGDYTHGMAYMVDSMVKPERRRWTNLNVVSKCVGCKTGYYSKA